MTGSCDCAWPCCGRCRWAVVCRDGSLLCGNLARAFAASAAVAFGDGQRCPEFETLEGCEWREFKGGMRT